MIIKDAAHGAAKMSQTFSELKILLSDLSFVISSTTILRAKAMPGTNTLEVNQFDFHGIAFGRHL